MNLIKKFSTVASATSISRIFGFIREMLVAIALGTGPVADAFNAAFRFPNTFRRLFAEGAFSSAFVPLFSEQIEKNQTEAQQFAKEVFSVLFAILLGLTLIMELSMPLLVEWIIAPGFRDDQAQFSLTIRLSMIMFPYLACISLASMMSGMLNALRHYFAASIAPLFLNIILIAILVFGYHHQWEAEQIGTSLAIGVMISGLIHLIIVWAAMRQAGMRLSLHWPRMTPNIRHLLILAFPAALTGGITQINLLINTNIASSQEGAVSSLAYADRLYQLPLGVIAIAIATILLPELSRSLRAGNLKETAYLQNRSLEFSLFLSLPAATAFLVLSQPIVQLLFEHGQFGKESTLIVSEILMLYGLGLPAFILIKSFIPSFFARKDTKTPMIFAAISVVINITLALTLFPVLSIKGIVLAEITAGWINAILLFSQLCRSGNWHPERLTLQRCLIFLFSCTLMGLFLSSIQYYFPILFSQEIAFFLQIAALASVILLATVIYFSTVFLVEKKQFSILLSAFKRKKNLN